MSDIPDLRHSWCGLYALRHSNSYRTSPPGNRDRGGFTLIELLVVIAIIAILASILFPVFAQARGKARETRDVSNLRQIMLAMEMYRDDYDESYPPGEPQGLDDSEWIIWQLDPYVKNSQIYLDAEKNKLVYFSALTYSVGIALDDDGTYLNADSYQCFFKGKDGKYDLAALEAVNTDNLWIDVENQRVIRFRKVQQSL
ncbi:MAG: prepilin-type N-terminal cleavage/methylation domain-containing protein [Armatimonadia bacterium]